MIKKLIIATLSSYIILIAHTTYAAPAISGEPVIVQHLGKLEWPQDVEPGSTPYLTQLVANDINDLHGNLSCDLIISTPGNYHMALKDAMYGRPDLGHTGLLEQVGTPSQFKVSICWTTSPPISVDQITAEKVQFKNIKMVGRPSLVMAPDNVMNTLVTNNMVDATSRQTFLVNQGKVILIRADKAASINSICDLGGSTRIVTPNPVLEPGTFENFSATIFDVSSLNSFGCDATTLFNSIFSQDISTINTSSFINPYDIDGILSVFGKGTNPSATPPKWIASSRIMHRDIPYALCHNEADASIIFYHLAKYLKATLAASGCDLAIVPLGGSESQPSPLPGNSIGKLDIAKVNGSFAKKVNDARNILYDFFTSDPMWATILAEYGMTTP